GAIGFVSADDLTASGTILGSPRREPWLAAEMPVYLSLGQGEVEPGDRLDIVRANQEVVDPETDRSLGVFVERLGWLEVTRVDAESSEAVIRSSFREIRAGDHLLPRREPMRDVKIRTAAPPVEGQVAFLPEVR